MAPSEWPATTARRSGGHACREHRLEVLAEAGDPVVAALGRRAVAVPAQVVGDDAKALALESADHVGPELERLGPAVGEHDRLAVLGTEHLHVQARCRRPSGRSARGRAGVVVERLVLGIAGDPARVDGLEQAAGRQRAGGAKADPECGRCLGVGVSFMRRKASHRTTPTRGQHAPSDDRIGFPTMRIGMLTGGGDCPGLNAVIRAVVRKGIDAYGDQLVGFRDGWRGVLEGSFIDLTIESTRGILPARRHDPRQLAHEPLQARRRCGRGPPDALGTSTWTGSSRSAARTRWGWPTGCTPTAST